MENTNENGASFIFVKTPKRKKRNNFLKISEEAVSEESQIGAKTRGYFWVSPSDRFSDRVKQQLCLTKSL